MNMAFETGPRYIFPTVMIMNAISRLVTGSLRQGGLTGPALFSLALPFLGQANAAEPGAAERLLALNRPLVIAHRGFSMLAPENTLPALRMAVKAGADLVELDYHHSSDGVPVVIHDYDLDRTTNAREKGLPSKTRVDARQAAELRELDAGQWFDPHYTAIKVPLLTEALEVIQDGGVTLIERKAGDAQTCVELLRERNLVNEVVVQAFDWDYLRDFHALEPRQVLGALGPPSTINGRRLSAQEKELDSGWIDQVKQLGARAVVWNKQVSREAVANAHEKGLKVWVYTINDEALANQLLDLGIDGIITDNPSLIWRALALREQK